MAITHVNTQTASGAVETSLTVTKPSGSASGDLYIAIFTSNSQNCTPPSGWTELFDEAVDVFRCQVFYKVAGGSEPANYTFSVPADAPLVASISAFRGINTSSPIDISPIVQSDLGAAEPYTMPTLSGGTVGAVLSLRACRRSGTSPLTFTASGGTEVTDVGIFSGGSVAYSHALYFGSAGYSGTPTAPIGITASSGESHNVVAAWGIKSSSIPAAMEIYLPSLPTVSMSGSWSHVAAVDVDMPRPDVDAEIFVGAFDGTLDVEVPIDVGINATIEPTGTMDTLVPVEFDVLGETRHFAGNVITFDREERWFIITQEGYRLGIRSGVDLPMRIDLPLPIVSISGSTFPLAPHVSASSEAFDVTSIGGVQALAEHVSVTASASPPSHVSKVVTASASVVADDATVASASIALAEHVSVAVSVEGTPYVAPDAASASVSVPDVSTLATFSVGAASASAVAYGASASKVSSVSASVSVYDAAVSNSTTRQAFAGEVEVFCTNDLLAPLALAGVQVNTATPAASPSAGHAAVTVAANDASAALPTQAPAGHAAVSTAATQSSASVKASAGHVSVLVVAEDSEVSSSSNIQASAALVSAQAVANQPTVTGSGVNQAPAGHALVSVDM